MILKKLYIKDNNNNNNYYENLFYKYLYAP